MESTYNFDFEHKTIDKIYGEPNARSLQKVFKQLRRNARSITSPLGGGQYGHLFMVMTQNDWDNLPNDQQISNLQRCPSSMEQTTGPQNLGTNEGTSPE